MAEATTNPSPNSIELEALPDDPGAALMTLLVKRALMGLKADEVTPAFLEFCRKLAQDNAVTLSSVRRGDFGEVFKRAAEQFPFSDDTQLSN